jgi:serine/threonine protein kinase
MLQYTCLGDRGPSHAELDWPVHLKIAQGMGYLHTQLNPSNIPHGNLKSSNILLSPNYHPLLSNYRLSTLIKPANAAQAFFSYKAPEAIFILEIVIGGNRHPRRLLHVKVFTSIRFPSSQHFISHDVPSFLKTSFESVNGPHRLFKLSRSLHSWNPHGKICFKRLGVFLFIVFYDFFLWLIYL